MNTLIPDKIIDFHVHLFPDEFFDAIRAFFKREYGLDVVHKLNARESIDYLRSRDVGTIVYSNYAHKKDTARMLNTWNVDLLDRDNDIYCFAAFHPDDEDAVSQAREFISHPRILGFKLHFLVQRFRPDDERLFPLYELAIEHGKRLLMHVGTGPVGNEYVGIRNLQEVLKRYPDLPLNIAHMGAFEFRESFSLLEQYPKVYLDTSFCFLPGNFRMYTLGSELLETHRTRLLYGSDFPNIFHDRQEELDALAGLGLSPELYECMFRTNALRVLGRRE